MTNEDRDRLMSAIVGRRCPLCGGLLVLNKEKYGWGSQGGRAKCSHCGLQLRLPWVPLRRAILKLAKGKRS